MGDRSTVVCARPDGWHIAGTVSSMMTRPLAGGIDCAPRRYGRALSQGPDRDEKRGSICSRIGSSRPLQVRFPFPPGAPFHGRRRRSCTVGWRRACPRTLQACPGQSPGPRDLLCRFSRTRPCSHVHAVVHVLSSEPDRPPASQWRIAGGEDDLFVGPHEKHFMRQDQGAGGELF